jgi:hypothetical protein
MASDGKPDDFVQAIETLPIPDEDKAFLIDVRRQYEAECARALSDDDSAAGQ